MVARGFSRIRDTVERCKEAASERTIPASELARLGTILHTIVLNLASLERGPHFKGGQSHKCSRLGFELDSHDCRQITAFPGTRLPGMFIDLVHTLSVLVNGGGTQD